MQRKASIRLAGYLYLAGKGLDTMMIVELRGSSVPVNRQRELNEACKLGSKANDRLIRTTQTDWETSRSIIRTV